MAKDYPALTAHHHAFIAAQHMFFTASAAAGTRINISLRSTDWLRSSAIMQWSISTAPGAATRRQRTPRRMGG